MQQAAGGADSQQQQQQQWVAMQYPPAAAMVMPHQMVAAVPPPPPPQYSQHFLSYHQPPPPQHHQHQAGAAAGEENKTIWVGDLHYWMEENYLHSCFGHTGEVVSIKVIRNKQTGQSEGYGFVEFYTRAAAEKVLQNFVGHIMPNTDQPFRLNWASFSMGDRRSDVASDHSIFVGDLAADVTDAMLQETFASKYPSVKGAKVVIDANTGRSKGYGFVRFGNDNEKTLAMTEMNGVYCSSRPMRIGPATPRKSSGGSGNSASGQSDGDSTNTTVFVGGLDPNVSEDDLRQAFSQYGEIASVKIPVGKQCGFVQFVQRNNAQEALQALNGTVIGKQQVRLSWGRNPANKQLRGDHGNQWNNFYYGAPFYNGYGYAAPFPDPTMYAAAYGAYSFNGNQQQVN
ncbi:polyadenylate-binding protein RBP47-like isoform X1 [Phoenix dactylifera]|uniref:Polyadenylate-binding protein RBP47-like isoform X1 n=1 Tax=Phoenix dactylifera TaxID=42345 RepID=A0A8B7D545_PHODC|nr:polyadenylate-binding protein RBP47-like isoform X1 [Phoenix dactylifera]